MDDIIKKYEDVLQSPSSDKVEAAFANYVSDFNGKSREQFPNQHSSFDSPFMPDGEPVIGKTYRADGWVYYDPPTAGFTPEMWDLLLSYFGENEYHILAMTFRQINGEDMVRGQLLISPQGLENAKSKLKVNDD